MAGILKPRTLLLAQMGAMICVIYGLCTTFVGPDLRMFLFPWIEHIRAAGPIDAFAAPFSNYTPPYLYLLSIGALITNSNLAIVKALSILSNALAGVGVWRAMRPHRAAVEAGVITLLLPTMIADGPFFGQCDGIWAGLCVLSVAAALEGRLTPMVLWFGAALAFKAQAAFLAPFVAVVLIQRRGAWPLWLVPPSVYCLAMLPALMAGWPAINLATVYLRQAQYFNTISTAPGLWSIAATAMPRTEPNFLWVGYLAAIVFVGWYVLSLGRRELSREKLIEAALLAAVAVPFLLPKMHERFTFLADLLAFTLAFTYAKRANTLVVVGVLGASSLGYLAYMTSISWLNIAGCLVNGWVLYDLVGRLSSSTVRAQSQRSPDSPLTVTPHS